MSQSIRIITLSRRSAVIPAFVLICLLLVICGEGIASADEVNSAGHLLSLQDDPEPPPTRVSIHAAEWIMLAVGVMAVWIFFATGWYRLKRVPRRPQIVQPSTGFILVLLLLLAGAIGAIVTRAMFGIEPEDVSGDDRTPRANAILVAGQFAGQLLVLIGVVVLWSKSRRLTHETRPHPIRAAALGVGAFTLFWPIVLLVSIASGLLVVVFTGRPVDPVAHSMLELFMKHALDGWMILLILMVVIAAPLVEEVMYRGIVQELLGRLGIERWTAIVITSVIFAAMHLPAVELHAIGTLFVLSLGFGWIYEKTGRLTAPIAMHIVFNAANVGLVLAGVAS